MTEESKQSIDIIELASELTIAWLNNPNNRVSADEAPAFLQRMHATLSGLKAGGEEATAPTEPSGEYTPAVSVRKSLASPDHIISLIDGKPYRTLRRHLAGHGLTPEQYRDRYNLKPDYPMVSKSYSETRRAMAHKIGLGSKRRGASQADAAEAQPAPSKPKRAPRRKAEDAA